MAPMDRDSLKFAAGVISRVFDKITAVLVVAAFCCLAVWLLSEILVGRTAGGQLYSTIPQISTYVLGILATADFLLGMFWHKYGFAILYHWDIAKGIFPSDATKKS